MKRYLVTATDIENNLKDLSQVVFDVTQKCNLRCKYCIYSGMYEGFESSRSTDLPVEMAFGLLDYLFDIWKKDAYGLSRTTNIGFFGGEPLLNFHLIEAIVTKTQSEAVNVGRKFNYSMTTNAVLLPKYMDFIVKHNFDLLISLDGDFNHNSLRIDALGKSSFSRVFDAVHLLKTQYPEYFTKRVSFNTVISSNTNIDDLLSFFLSNFGKTPGLSQINSTGIKPEKRDAFQSLYLSKDECMATSCNGWASHKTLFMESPEIRRYANYIFGSSGNVFTTYNDLFIDRATVPIVPTGTCIPFAKKLFLSATGKILQCEKIDHEYCAGTVSANGDVNLDCVKIANTFNNHITSFSKLCRTCTHRLACTQCLYQSNDYRSGLICSAFSTSVQRDKALEALGDSLRKHPEIYQEIIDRVTLY